MSRVTTPRVAPIGACPLCGNPRSAFMFEVGDRLHKTPGKYSYRRCLDCRTVYQDPQVIPADLPLCYPDLYYTHEGSTEYSEQDSFEPPTRNLHGVRDKLRQSVVGEVRNDPMPGVWGAIGKVFGASKSMRERAFYGMLVDELLPKSPVKQRALEIGCGSGRHLLGIKTQWVVEGVEWDPKAAAAARSRTGCLIWEGDFQTLDLPIGAYHLIFMHHVFEHLADPLAALQRLWDLLAPTGRAFLIYPNPQALGGRLYGDAWFPWEVPRHLVFLPLSTFMQAAKKIGFRPLRCETRSTNAAEYFSRSRLYKQGLPVDETISNAKGQDRVLEWVERLLILMGMDAGEEVVIVLEKGA